MKKRVAWPAQAARLQKKKRSPREKHADARSKTISKLKKQRGEGRRSRVDKHRLSTPRSAKQEANYEDTFTN